MTFGTIILNFLLPSQLFCVSFSVAGQVLYIHMFASFREETNFLVMRTVPLWKTLTKTISYGGSDYKY